MFFYTLPGILLSLIIYVVPVIIYRYCIAKKTIAMERAIKIVLCEFFIFSTLMAVFAEGDGILSVFAVLFASFFNFRILIGFDKKLSPVWRYLVWRERVSFILSSLIILYYLDPLLAVIVPLVLIVLFFILKKYSRVLYARHFMKQIQNKNDNKPEDNTEE